MGKELEIADCIRRMAGIPGNPFVVAKASNINEDDKTCDGTPEDGSAKITGIRLVSITGVHESTVVIPEDDSLILVAMLSNTDAYLMHCSKAKKLMIKVGNSTVDITDGLINMNGGNNDGLVLLAKMVSWMQKVYNDMTTLQTLLLNSPVVGNGAILNIAFTPGTPSPSNSDFENTKIKQ